MDNATVQQALRTIEPNYEALAKEFGADALPFLQEFAERGSEHEAAAATYLASLIDPAGAAAIAYAALAHESPVVRLAGAGALARIDDADAASHLVGALADEDDGVRRTALRTAGKFAGDATVTDAVAKVAAEDANAALRNLAGRMLPRVRGEAPTEQEVEAAIRTGKPDADTAAALGQAAIPILAKLMPRLHADEVPNAILLARFIPGGGQDTVYEAATKHGSETVRRAARRVLARSEPV